MTTQNEEAEEIMRKIEREEEAIQFREPEKQVSLFFYRYIS